MLDAGNEITWNGYTAVKCSIDDSDEDGIPDEFEASLMRAQLMIYPVLQHK